jgi:aldose 1-epimerase
MTMLTRAIEINPPEIITLKNKNMSVELSNLGGIITGIYTKDRLGNFANIVAGFSCITDYKHNPYYFGCILGRNAGRIGKGRYELNGQTIQLSKNDGQNHLHGGIEGFDKKLWRVETHIKSPGIKGVTLEYFSPDGEEGYPGNLLVNVTYTLNDQNQLKIKYEATTDKTTPVNLSNHTYFNLTAFTEPTILNHRLQVLAQQFSETDKAYLPTGNLLPVPSSAADLLNNPKIGKLINGLLPGGLNHNYVLDNWKPGEVALAAVLSEPLSGRTVTVFTDRPGLQVYTANDWDGSFAGSQGRPYCLHGAVALETQSFPDAPNHKEFPTTFLQPGEQYNAETIYDFSLYSNDDLNLN